MFFRFLAPLALVFISAFAYAQKPVLTIYAYDSFTAEWGVGPAVEKAFEEKCNCDLQMIGLESSLAVLSRLQLEGNNTKADIILGLDTASMGEAKNTNLLQPHNIKPENLSLPQAWTDEVFLPYDYGYFAFIYDKRRLQNPPASLAELLENKDNLKIVFSDARFSSVGLGLVLWMKHIYGDDATQAWQQLQPNILSVPPSWSSAYKLFTSGEADMVLSYTTSPAYHIIAEEDENYDFAPFTEGHYMQIETAAMTKNANKTLATEFLQFMLSDEFQSLIPEGQWMYPVTNISIPKAFGKAPKALLFSAETVTENRKIWLQEWQNAIGR